MSPRRRLGVALLLDPPWSLEVQGLRRALGDSSLGSVAPHLTLVPPINVRSSDLASALDTVRKAAAVQAGPFSLHLGPAATFVPTNPVVYLAVGGAGMAPLRALREAVLAGPLLRPDRWPWVPHVTLADQAPHEQAEAALVALRHYESEVTLDRVVIMEERARCWHPLADACFGRPAVVGRGGLELEITEGRLLRPDALEIVMSADGMSTGGLSASGLSVGGLSAGGLNRGGADGEGGTGAAADGEGRGAVRHDLVAGLPPHQTAPSIVLTGRRQGQVTGVAVAWHDGLVGAGAQVCVFVDLSARGQGVGRALLVALESSARRRGWEIEQVRGYGPPGFFTASSAWIRDVHPVVELQAQHLPA